MADPVQRDLLVEVAFGADLAADPGTWTWQDVSGDLLSQSITINRGRADEASETQPTATSLTLDNLNGDYTPDNPVGVYYPNVKRGTPLRITAPGAESYLVAGGTAAVSTPDTAALDISGDIDIRLDLAVDPANLNTDLIGKYGAAGNRSWLFTLDTLEQLKLWWSADGTVLLNLESTVPVRTVDRICCRVTLDVDNGAGGHTATFYTGPTLDGPWTQVGDPVTGVGTTGLFNSTVQLAVGDVGTSFAAPQGKIWAAQVYNGIGGTLVADADFRGLDPATTSFIDSVGRTWTLGGGAELSDLSTRFVGQVDSWEPSWPVGDVTGGEPPHSVCDLSVSSVRRRLQQGSTALESPLRAAIPAAARGSTGVAVAYWPMEDGPDATVFASGMPGGPPMAFLGAPVPAASSDYIASGPLPTFNGAGAIGSVPPYTAATDRWQVSCVVVLPEGGVTDEAVLLDIRTNGTAARYVVKYDTGGSGGQLRLQVFSSAVPPVELLNTTVDPDFDGRPFLLYIEGGNSGTAAIWTIGRAVVESLSTVPTEATTSSTIATSSAPRVVSVGVGTDLTLNNDIAIGHVAVWNELQIFFFNPNVFRALIANAGESAIDRFVRLCEDIEIPYAVVGGVDVPSELMGAQTSLDFIEAVTETADSDAGILLDRLDTPGMLLRPRATLYRQEPALVLDAAVNGIANPFTPVLDDQRIRNDITVTRASGASTRLVDEASVAEEGRYDEAITLSLFTDDQTAGQASWRLNLGTVAGMRYSTVTVDFDTAEADLLTDWLSLGVDVGDLIRVKNLPRQHAPDDVDLIIQGYSETITPSRWQVTFNCSPAGPYRVGIYDGTGTRESRYASGNTTLDEDLDTTETDIDITTPTPPYWTTDAGQYPLDVMVGGERITVAGCTGAGPGQTFTGCTRSVNGVVKTHTTGDAIDLFTPTYYAL